MERRREASASYIENIRTLRSDSVLENHRFHVERSRTFPYLLACTDYLSLSLSLSFSVSLSLSLSVNIRVDAAAAVVRAVISTRLVCSTVVTPPLFALHFPPAFGRHSLNYTSFSRCKLLPAWKKGPPSIDPLRLRSRAMGNDRLCKMDESKKRKGGGMRRGIRRHVCRETNFGWFRIFLE